MLFRSGDFLTTGGGPMKDFFEQVAPKVGVTADMFKNLSGPQALGLYVDTLQKAGANQQEMTFFLEAMASDATALLPLLQNNGKAMNEFGTEAENLGLILSEDTIKAAKQFNEDLDVLGRVAGSVGQSVAAELLPELGKLTEALRDPETIQAAVAMAKGVTSAFTDIIAAARETVGFIKWASESAAAYLHGAAPDDLVRRENEIVSELEASNNKLKELAGEIERPRVLRINPFQSTPELESEYSAMLGRIKTLEQARDDLYNKPLQAPVTLPAPAAGGGSPGLGAGLGIDLAAAEKAKAGVKAVADAEKEQQKQRREAEKEIERQRREAEKAATEALKEQERIQQNYRDLVASLRTEDEQRLDTMREQLAVLDAMKGIPDAERAGVAGRIAGAATSEAPEFAGLAPEVGGPFGELTKIDEAEEVLAKWYATQLEQLDTFRQERADLTATWDAEELSLKQQHEDSLARIEQARQTAQLAAAESIFGDLAGMAQAFAGEQSGLYKAMFAVQKAASIAQSMVAIQTGIAMAAANPFPANLAAMASVAAATASIVGNIGAIGMAHEGIDSIPQTGTWLLERGERVTTAQTSAKLDKTLSDIQSSRATGGDGRPIQITVHQPGVTNAREARESSAAAARRISRAVQGAGRYN